MARVMSAKVDMSLDEVIQSGPGGRGRKVGKGAGRGRFVRPTIAKTPKEGAAADARPGTTRKVSPVSALQRALLGAAKASAKGENQPQTAAAATKVAPGEAHAAAIVMKGGVKPPSGTADKIQMSLDDVIQAEAPPPRRPATALGGRLGVRGVRPTIGKLASDRTSFLQDGPSRARDTRPPAPAWAARALGATRPRPAKGSGKGASGTWGDAWTRGAAAARDDSWEAPRRTGFGFQAKTLKLRQETARKAASAWNQHDDRAGSPAAEGPSSWSDSWGKGWKKGGGKGGGDAWEEPWSAPRRPSPYGAQDWGKGAGKGGADAWAPRRSSAWGDFSAPQRPLDTGAWGDSRPPSYLRFLPEAMAWPSRVAEGRGPLRFDPPPRREVARPRMMRAELEEPTSRLAPAAPVRPVRAAREPAAPAAGATIRVTNVPRNLDDQDVQEAFEEIGKIVSCEVKKGTAIISFTTAASAKKAVAAFDRGELNGQQIQVELDDGGKDRAPARVEKAPVQASIRVSNVPIELDKRGVKEAFEEIGKVTRCEVDQGVALITFANPADAKKAVQTFDRGELNNQTIYVAPSDDRQGTSQLLTPAKAVARTTVRVSNVPVELDKRDVKEAFEEIGKVTRCEVDRGVAMITFSSAADAKKAIQTFDRGELNGQTIFVAASE